MGNSLQTAENVNIKNSSAFIPMADQVLCAVVIVNRPLLSIGAGRITKRKQHIISAIAGRIKIPAQNNARGSTAPMRPVSTMLAKFLVFHPSFVKW